MSDTDQFLVIGSDGVWDDIKTTDVIDTLKSKRTKNKISEDLVNKIFNHAAISSNHTVEELKNLPLGTRRRYHDDITLIVMDMKNQF